MIQVVQARASEVRCPLCFASLDGGDVRTCARCRTGTHGACAVELATGECPTAGCATPLARRRIVVVPRPEAPGAGWRTLLHVSLLEAVVIALIGLFAIAAVTNHKNSIDSPFEGATKKVNSDITASINGG